MTALCPDLAGSGFCCLRGAAVDVFSLLWILWGLMFVAVEATAIVRGDRPSEPRTLSANIWWLVRGAGTWHHVARGVLVVGLAWLVPHLLS